MTEKNDAVGQSFITGFITGAMVSGAGFYLAFTKSGRKLAKQVLQYAEEIGEKGEIAVQEVAGSNEFQEIKEKTNKKIGNIVDKLKLELKDVKKAVDRKK